MPDSNDEAKEWFKSFLDRMKQRQSEPYQKFNFDPYKTVRTEDVVKLSREGFCTFACDLLYAFLGKGELFGLKNEASNTISHYFLFLDGKALDLGGFCELDEMKCIFGLPLEIKKVEWKQLHQDLRILGMDAEEKSILTERFKNRIHELFPPGLKQ